MTTIQAITTALPSVLTSTSRQGKHLGAKTSVGRFHGISWVASQCPAAWLQQVRRRCCRVGDRVDSISRDLGVAMAIVVTLLGRVEFARFAYTYFLAELPLMLVAVGLFRRQYRGVIVPAA